MPLLKTAGMLGLCCLSALSPDGLPHGSRFHRRRSGGVSRRLQSQRLSALASVPPTGNVSAFLSTGLIQTFPGAADNTQTYALIKPDATSTLNVMQVLPGMFGYYGYLGYAAAGFPTTDTAACPTLVSVAAAGNSCQWQSFSGDYALFVYNPPRFPTAPRISSLQIRSSRPGIFSVESPSWAPRPGCCRKSRAGTTLRLSRSRSTGGQSTSSTAFPTPGPLRVKAPIFAVYAHNGGRSRHDGVSGHWRDSSIERDAATVL